MTGVLWLNQDGGKSNGHAALTILSGEVCMGGCPTLAFGFLLIGVTSLAGEAASYGADEYILMGFGLVLILSGFCSFLHPLANKLNKVIGIVILLLLVGGGAYIVQAYNALFK